MRGTTLNSPTIVWNKKSAKAHPICFFVFLFVCFINIISVNCNINLATYIKFGVFMNAHVFYQR